MGCNIMSDILEKLKHKEIISPKNVLELRNYISNKYPNLSSHEASIFFANSIHKIIDNNLKHFDKKHRDDIRQRLISNSVHKSSFIITADEIFYTFIDLNIDSDICIDSLVDWVNDNQDIEISKEYLLDIVAGVRKCHKEYPIENIQIDSNFIASDNGNAEKSFSMKADKLPMNKHLGVVICVFLIALFSITIYKKSIKTEDIISMAANDVIELETRNINELPTEFKYKNIDIERLRECLNVRDSKLAEEPYLTAIINTAEQFDINPVLLIAITGQEQGFVPRSNEYAEKIVNNPFNVYGSWIKYNTDIYDSSKIAAITLINLSKDRPSHVDTIQWINRKYAEDENWHKGVTSIFYMLSEELALAQEPLTNGIDAKDL